MKKNPLFRRSNSFNIADWIVKFLNSDGNGDRAMQTELRRIILLWLESGPHTGKLMRDYPDLIPLNVPCFLVPNHGRLEVKFQPASIAAEDPSPEKRALMLFLQLLTSIEPERVAGPCACGCDGFFLKDGKYRKVYIKGHGSRATASEHMRRKQAEKRAPRVRAVNRALAKYARNGESSDWKEYVESETNFAVTINTLARWAEKGWINAPQMGGR